MISELDSFLEHLIENLPLIEASEIPNIDLYMDQVTTFMDEHLGSSKRYEADKVLTKTMINNYTKNNLLPPPEKKKYSKEHVLLLTFIYYFKNILSINDIKKLLHPINEKYFNTEEGLKLEEIYTQISRHELNQVEGIKNEITARIHEAGNTFTELESGQSKDLQYFTLICSLAFDVYIKKHLIESLIDNMKDPEPQKETSKQEKAAKSKN